VDRRASSVRPTIEAGGDGEPTDGGFGPVRWARRSRPSGPRPRASSHGAGSCIWSGY